MKSVLTQSPLYAKAILYTAAWCAATAYCFFNSIYAILPLIIPGVWVFRGKVRQYKQKEDTKLLTEFRDAVTAMGAALSAGYSSENAIRETVVELMNLYGKEAEIVGIFYSMVNRMKNGERLEDLLAEFASESGLEDAKSFSEVFGLVRQRGGDIVGVIQNTIDLIQQRIRVQEEIEIQTASRRLEGQVMQLMPYFIVVYLRIAFDGFLDPLYGNVMGVCFMCGCLAVCLVGNVLTERLADIEM